MLARRRVVFADTAAAAFRADVFRAAGGFRTDMKAVEDTEFSFRLAAAGHKLVVAPQARVYHRHPESLWQYARRKFRYGLWGVWAYVAFPRRVTDDSRTPWSMRLQMLLAPLLVATTLVVVFNSGWQPMLSRGWLATWSTGWLAPWSSRLPATWLALLIAFLLSVAPFAWRTRDDPAVALTAPLLFFIRGLAVSTGLAIGLLRLAASRTLDGTQGHDR